VELLEANPVSATAVTNSRSREMAAADRARGGRSTVEGRARGERGGGEAADTLEGEDVAGHGGREAAGGGTEGERRKREREREWRRPEGIFLGCLWCMRGDCWSPLILPPRNGYYARCKNELCLSYLHYVVGLSLIWCYATGPVTPVGGLPDKGAESRPSLPTLWAD
jgi:hypothetical protein